VSETPRTQPVAWKRRLAELALERFVPGHDGEEREALFVAMLELVEIALSRLDPAEMRSMRFVPTGRGGSQVRAPPYLVGRLRAALVATCLGLWLRRHRSPAIERLNLPDLERDIERWLASQPVSLQLRIIQAGIRDDIGRATVEDRALLGNSAGHWLAEKGVPMASPLRFQYDTGRLPASFDQKAFEAAVNQELESNLNIPNTEDNLAIYAAVKGLLLIDDIIDPNSFGFSSEIQKRYFELLGKTKDGQDQNGKDVLVPNTVIYNKILDTIPTLPGRAASSIVFYQEFATIGRYVIKNAADVPPSSPNFATQVRIGDDTYVSGQDAFGVLDLPLLTGDDGTDQEIQPDLVIAVGKIHSAYHIDVVIRTVARVSELWTNGQLPVALDDGGQLLDRWYWNSYQRFNDPARFMHFTRILGVRGGEVSREVQPNPNFDRGFTRALSSLAEYDRQQRIVDLFSGQPQSRSLSRTGENVRSAIRDLATNVTLYGWGSAPFVANRLMQMLNDALEILKNKQILRAYAVTNPWQIIERQVLADTGSSPNIVKYRTMAEQSKVIFDLIAKYARAWSGSSGLPLFPDPSQAGQASDITADDQVRLMRATQLILAVRGTKDDEVYEASQPAEAVAAPSIPSMGDAGQNASMDQIRQMVAQGKTPSLDELKNLIPMGSNGTVKMGL
jgi:hypothetical protein